MTTTLTPGCPPGIAKLLDASPSREVRRIICGIADIIRRERNQDNRELAAIVAHANTILADRAEAGEDTANA